MKKSSYDLIDKARNNIKVDLVQPIEEAYKKGNISIEELDDNLIEMIESGLDLNFKMLKRKAFLNCSFAVGFASMFPIYYLSGQKNLLTNLIPNHVFQSANSIEEIALKTVLDCAILIPVTVVGGLIYKKLAKKIDLKAYAFTQVCDVVSEERERIISEQYGSVEEYERVKEMEEIYGFDKEKE